MIVSETIKINVDFPVSNSEIEKEFKLRNLDVLRWAIIYTDKDSVTVNISHKI